MIGGAGSFFGPICGTAIFQVIEEITHHFTDRVELVTGAILVLVIMFAPQGLAGFITSVKQRYFSSPAAGAKKEET